MRSVGGARAGRGERGALPPAPRLSQKTPCRLLAEEHTGQQGHETRSTSSPSGRHRSRLPPAREDGHSDRQMDSRTDSRTCGRGLGTPARAAAEGTVWRCPVKSRNPPRARVWERGVHGPVLTALFSGAKGGGHPGAPRRTDGQVSAAPPRSGEPLSLQRPGWTSRTLAGRHESVPGQMRSDSPQETPSGDQGGRGPSVSWGGVCPGRWNVPETDSGGRRTTEWTCLVSRSRASRAL